MWILFSFPRPLWVEFPDDLETFGVDDEYMLGKYLSVNYSCDRFYDYAFIIIFSSENTLSPRKTTIKTGSYLAQADLKLTLYLRMNWSQVQACLITHGAGDWTWSLMHTRQVLYQISYTPSPPSPDSETMVFVVM